jgi:phosphopantothenoylcysteine decarboxylase / phosphopantothenate---cysteine ligase
LRILLGITGGIAAYKAASLIRAFSEKGHEVTVLPTENALRFIGKPTLEALSGHAIETDMYQDVASVRHVSLGQNADLIVIAPATASFLARLAAGIADDLMLNAILASKAPVYVCPAMHTEMWENKATQNNLSILESRGIHILEPGVGRLTGSDDGKGRLPETDEILSFVLGQRPLSGKSVLITAGGTREMIDEVRFIGNSSSGRMGVELAIAARDAGAEVTLIAANIELQLPSGIEVIRVTSVDELEAAMDCEVDILIMAAAVSDFKIAKPFRGKLPRSEMLELKLEPTKDLVAAFAANHSDTLCVAFALAAGQEQDLIAVAQKKLWDKGVDVVIGNRSEVLGSSQTTVEFVTAMGSEPISGTKAEVSRGILKSVAEILSA